jgi:hypothetical protein
MSFSYNVTAQRVEIGSIFFVYLHLPKEDEENGFNDRCPSTCGWQLTPTGVRTPIFGDGAIALKKKLDAHPKGWNQDVRVVMDNRRIVSLTPAG